MLAEHAIDVLGEAGNAWDEFSPFEVEVLAPERTLLEKLALLHDAAIRSSSDTGRQKLAVGGRHIYDVHRLLGAEEVITALEQAGPDGVARLCADIDDHSSSAGFSFTPRPSGGYGESPLLDAPTPLRSVLEDAYTSAMALVYGDRPSLDECLETVRARSKLL